MARLTFLLLLLWVGVTVSRVVDLQKRIYGGKRCDDNERRYHVALSTSADGDPVYCGGSLIKPQWVLTSAHCQKTTMYAFVGVHPEPTANSQPPRKPVKIQDQPVIYQNHDIMLLKLPSPINDIDPVPLPDNNDCNAKPGIGEDVQVAGHSKFDQNGNLILTPKPKDLQCVTVKVVQSDIPAIKMCNPNEPDKNWISYEGRYMGAYEGDSGGGVIYKGKLRGVHTIGSTNGCTREGDSLDVCKYMPWIENNTK